MRVNDRTRWVDKSHNALCSDVNVRRAFAYALDTNSIVKKFSGKFYVRADKPQRVKAVEIMAEQLRTNLGMDLQPTPTDFKVFYKPIQAGNYDLAFAGWGLALDPDDYTIFSSKAIRPETDPSGTNWTGFVNSDLDAAIEA